MTDEELLFSLVTDKMNSCRDNYMITNTNFLDAYQQSKMLKYIQRNCSVSFEMYGGFPDAERKIIVFLPDYAQNVNYFDVNPVDNPISCLKIKKDGFSTLSHRDYLGAIMGLGIKREMIGDIAISDDGCSVAIIKSLLGYVINNLSSVGRGSVKVTESPDFSDFIKEEHFESKRCYVSSMRADSVIAAAFSLSRGVAAEKIQRGEVFINGLEVSKPDSHVSFGSKLVIHGKGKAIIDEDAGMTKKGRQAFIIKKYN